jgi:peptidoglycan hydrolase-like protein with peptidoglycan-binding domain
MSLATFQSGVHPAVCDGRPSRSRVVSRRDLGRVAAMMAVAVGVVGWPSSASAALPVVDMEAAVKAAQWDPAKSGTGLTPGAKASVLLIEQALVAQGLLASSYVDGHFGTKTVEAYAAWQRAQGFTGIGANGIPGRASLTALGSSRFSITRALTPGAKITFRGVPVNTRTRDMLVAAESILGWTFVLTQGSYSPEVDPTSAHTHDGGGAVDIDAVSLSGARRTAAAKALRRVGFAAWVRSPQQGSWPWHLHAVAISDTDLHPSAASQVGDYYEGRNGLANDGADDGPQVTKVTYEEYLRSL